MDVACIICNTPTSYTVMATIPQATIPAQHSTLNVLKTQVGGHSLILEIDKNYICKPMVDREVYFYENLPDSLKPFTPTYKGTCTIKRSIEV